MNEDRIKALELAVNLAHTGQISVADVTTFADEFDRFLQGENPASVIRSRVAAGMRE